MKNKKNVIMFAFIAIFILAAIALISKIDFKTPEKYYSSVSEEFTEDAKTVFLSIRCDTVLDNWDLLTKELQSSGLVPSDGVILPKTKFLLNEGDTIFDLLLKAAKQYKIQLDFHGNPDILTSPVYVKGINYLYEFSCGPLSGWLFKVNDEFSGDESSAHLLSDKDYVQWVYTCDLGRDVGNILEEDDVQ